MRGRLVTALVASLLLSRTPAVPAVEITVSYVDGPGEGFNDPSLGASRRRAFELAMGVLGDLLGGAVPVEVEARMDPMGGSSSSATLGTAGPTFVMSDFEGAPEPGTWYAAALANQLTLPARDLVPGEPEIEAFFNSDVDDPTVLGSTDWYYGTDGNPGGHVDFVSVVLHELIHGLNFLDLIDPATGAWLEGIPDIYGRNLVQGTTRLTSMTDFQRWSAIRSNDLHWDGPDVVASAGGPVEVHAPAVYESGSSVSHWAVGLPEPQLMQPFYGGPEHDPGFGLGALRDMGWDVESGLRCGGALVTITGTPGPDTIYGTPGPDVIAGLDGDDEIHGAAGDDVICGGAGDDLLVGNRGNDLTAGNAGDDRIFGALDDDEMHGGPGNDVIQAGPGNDFGRGGGGADRLLGNTGSDDLDGGGQNDVVQGSAGDDLVSGGPGNDTVLGAGGSDVVLGGDGDDLVVGGPGVDDCEGGSGLDDLRSCER